MLRRCLCVRLSPKCVFLGAACAFFITIVLALIFNINHDFGQSRTPLEFFKPRRLPDIREVDSSEKSEDKEDHTLYHRDTLNGSDDKQAERLINLLNNIKPAKSGVSMSKKVLSENVELLHDAILEELGRVRPSDSFVSECKVGGIRKGEVEDLLCIPRPKFVEEIKNPCWYDNKNPSGLLSGLRCLPYFHILGCAKAGTTDLWNRLMSHPHIISNNGLLHKEALWWSWRRFGIYGYKKGPPQSFESYVDLFQDTANMIGKSIKRNNHFYKVLITGDASPPDFWDFRGWRNISQNRDLSFPEVMTPQLMKHMYPDPKFILMFKDPIDRLYSDYFFVGGGLTSEDFHRDIINSLSVLTDCVRKRDILSCFYDNTVYKQMKVRLPFGCYSIFMREWLRVFSLEHFLFLKTEEYEAEPEETLKLVIDYLGLVPLKEEKLEEIADEERSRITKQKQVAGPMKETTKAILSHLFTPCNRQLALMTGYQQFNWET